MNDALSAIAGSIREATGESFAPAAARALGGGCINRAFALTDGARGYFVKLNDAARHAMFEAEADGLKALAGTHAMRVPEVICHGVAADQSFLVLELLDLRGRLDSALAGRQLAALHRATLALPRGQRFGWTRDNTIGATPQINTPTDDWVVFWRDRRLGYQLALAARRGHGGRLQRGGERLLADLDALIGHAPPPSLLHGDLWGGNLGALADGTPVIFDPAVYQGDREADLAMTELFGGFDARFHAAYRESWPLDPGYGTRKQLYNLYHILNHLCLFGGGYLQQAEQMIDRLLAELR